MGRAPVAALLVAGLSGPALAQPGGTTCPRDVLVAQSQQRHALDLLDRTEPDAARACPAWRRHVETMRRVAAVYGRCLTGPERAERLGQVQGSEREFSEAIKGGCRGN